MKVTLFPTLDEALALHGILIERFGGSPGVRDLGLLASALMRPQSGYYATLFLEAAALLQSLAMNHPFVDGNKRVAFALTAIFLRMNGHRIEVGPDAGETFMRKHVIEGRVEINAIATWLSAHAKRIRT